MGNRRPLSSQSPKGGAWNVGNGTGRQRLNIMVCDIEKQVLEIENFAGNMDRDNLPGPIMIQLMPIGVTGKQHAALVRSISFTH